jgi:hypothetical protein
LSGSTVDVIEPDPVDVQEPAERAFTGLAGRDLAEPTPVDVREPVERALPGLVGRETAETADPKKTAKAEKKAARQTRWLEKKKKLDPNFNANEAKRKRDARADENAENDRVAQIEEIRKKNPNPPFVMNDAPHGKGLLPTGGYDLERISNAQDRSQNHGRKRTAAGIGKAGYGPKVDLPGGAKDDPKEYDDQFAQLKAVWSRGKNQRVFRDFCYNNTTTSKVQGVRVCMCGHEIGLATGDSYEVVAKVFAHFASRHPEAIKALVARIQGNLCLEDHAGLVRRFAGTEKLYCGKCGKLVYDPKKGVSDAFGGNPEAKS